MKKYTKFARFPDPPTHAPVTHMAYPFRRHRRRVLWPVEEQEHEEWGLEACIPTTTTTP